MVSPGGKLGKDDEGAEPFTVFPVISRSGSDIRKVGIMD